jgi:transposase
VVLPLDYGLSLAQTARVIGRSVGWTCRLRNRFLAGEIVGDGQRQARGGRRRQNMTADQEREVLAPFLDRAHTGGILVVGQVKAELEASLGRRMALSSVYNLLHRHGWRKLAPDRRHPHSDPLAQAEWKKTPRAARPHWRALARARPDQVDVPGRGALRPHQRRAPLLGAQTDAPAMPSHADP